MLSSDSIVSNPAFNSIKSLIQYYLIAMILVVGTSVQAERTVFYQSFPTPPMPRFNPKNHVGEVHGCAFVDGGKTLVTVGIDKTIRLWDARTLEHKRVIYGNTQLTPARLDQGTYYCVAAHPTRNVIAVAGRLGLSFSGVRLIDLDRDIQLGKGNKGEKIVYALAFSPDGRWLLAGTYSGKILLYEIFPDNLNKDAMQFREMFHVNETIKLLKFPDQGNHFIYQTSDNTTQRAFVDPENKRITTGIGFPIRGFASISPDGKHVLGHNQNDDLSIFEAATARQVKTLKHTLHQGSIPNATFAADSKKIYYAKSDELWAADWTTNQGRSLMSVCDYQKDISSGRNGLVALVGGRPTGIYVVDSKTNQVIAEGGVVNSINAIGWGIENPLQIAWGFGHYGGSGTFKRGFDFSKMVPIDSGFRSEAFQSNLTKLNGRHVTRQNWTKLVLDDGSKHTSPSSILDFSFTSSGKLAYSSWWHNGLVSTTNMDAGLPDPFFGVTMPCGTVWAVVGNGQLPIVATGGEDGVIQIWKEDDGKLLVNLYVDDAGEWVCWTPLGYYAASADGRQYLDWVSDHGTESLSRTFTVSQAKSVFDQPALVQQVVRAQILDQHLIDMVGLEIPELDGGIKIHRLPFSLSGKGIPIKHNDGN